MGNFRSDNRGGFGGRSNRERSGGNRYGGGRSSDNRFGGRSGGRDRFGDRDSRNSERRPLEMHEVTCNKCGKQCEVPFKPTSSKPVYCSDCFRKNEGIGSNFGSRNQSRPSPSGISQEQFSQLNTKLDKIIQFLEDLEIESDEDLEEDSDEDSEDEEESEEEPTEDLEDNSDKSLDADSEEDLSKESGEDYSKNY